jgi:thiol-disulfide isomerase/thioredoxin
MDKKNNKTDKSDNNNLILYKDIYGMDKSILELKLKDFKYNKKKLTINNDYFSENKGLIIFYAPWCKYCTKISDILIDLAMSNINVFNFGAVNTEDIENGNDYVAIYANITKIPCIKYINNKGELINYEYEYTNDNFIYFINVNI